MPQQKKEDKVYGLDFMAWFREETAKNGAVSQAVETLIARTSEVERRTALAGWMATIALGVAVIGTLGLLLLSK